MMADRVRIDAYHRALARAIGPDSVVLDIGAGAGILSLMACRLGARHVYAVEPAASIHVAREIAAANGYADRITFVEGLSTDLTLPEPADVIVSDMRGVLPFHRHHIPSVIDARARLLASGGVLIPIRDTVWAAPVEAPDAYNRLVAPWSDVVYGLDLRRARAFATNNWTRIRVAPGQLLAAPQEWASVRYETVEHAGAQREITFEAARAGSLHGFAAWFDADLGEGVRFSNAPGQPELIYGQGFFPLSGPVALEAGDRLTLDLRADLVGDEYVWQWSTQVVAGAASAEVKATFRQSTFLGAPLAAASLRKRAAGFVPRPTADAQVDALILALMDGKTASGDIARIVVARFPSRFPSWEDALARVGRVSLEYSE